MLLSLFYVLGSCNENPYRQGEILYDNFCANCHMEAGQGLGQLNPPLALSDYLEDNQNQLACLIRNGMQGEIIVNGSSYDQPMPGVPQLNDVEITNVINFINQAWGNDYGVIKLQEVQEQLKSCQ